MTDFVVESLPEVPESLYDASRMQAVSNTSGHRVRCRDLYRIGRGRPTGVPESQSPYQNDLDNHAASLASMAMTSAAVPPAGAIIAPGDLLAHARSLTTDQVLDYINVGWRGICVKLVDLAPCIEVCFERIENGEEVAGYTSKKEFCKNVLNKTYGAVKFMLEANRRHDAEHAQDPWFRLLRQ